MFAQQEQGELTFHGEAGDGMHLAKESIGLSQFGANAYSTEHIWAALSVCV